MGIEDNLLLVPLLCGPIFMIAGLIMSVFPPRKINGLYGYRTPNSMKDQEKWDFAQKYSSRELVKFGGILLLTSAFGFFFEPGSDSALYVGLGLMIAIILVLFIKVENAIKNEFPDEKDFNDSNK